MNGVDLDEVGDVLRWTMVVLFAKSVVDDAFIGRGVCGGLKSR